MKSLLGNFVRSASPKLLAGSMLATSIFAPSFCAAQAPSKEAAVKIELKPADVIGSSFGKALDLEGMLDQQGDDEAKIVKEIASVEAVVAFPEKVSDLMEATQSGKSPVEFYAVVKFKDSASVDKLKSKIENDSSESFEKDGRTHYRPKGQGNTNVSATILDGKTLVFMTDSYSVGDDSFKKVTSNLKSMTAGKSQVDVAIDVDGARGLINEALDMAKGNPAAASFVIIPKQMDTLHLTIDTRSDSMIVLTGVSKDEATAKKLETSFGGLVAMAKAAMSAAPAGDPQADLAKEVVGSMKSSRDGMKVQITISKPEGFEDKLGELLGR